MTISDDTMHDDAVNRDLREPLVERLRKGEIDRR